MAGEVSHGTWAFLAILAPAIGVLCAVDGQQQPLLRRVGLGLLASAAVALANWIFGLWAFHIARPWAPRLQTSTKAPLISLEFLSTKEFPEGFAPLMALHELVATGEGVSGALVGHAMVRAEVSLRPGRHIVQIAPQRAMTLVVADGHGSRNCHIAVEAGPAAAGLEASVLRAIVEVPDLELQGVAEALDSLWDLWGRQTAGAARAGAAARRICVLVLHALEAALPIRLARIEATAVGEQLLLFFSGTVGPIPFVRVHLPTFVLPRLHSPLSKLLSTQPIVGKNLKKGTALPVAHPHALAGWKASADVLVAPVGIRTSLFLRDGSCSQWTGNFAEQGPRLHVQCDLSGSLDPDHLCVDLESIVLTTDAPDNKRSIRASASINLALSSQCTAQLPEDGGLPEVFFKAACQQKLETPLEIMISGCVDEGSELPEPFLLTVSDEHPLMLGRATVALLLTRAAVRGKFSVCTELPLRRKRDLLVMPDVDMQFEAAAALKEDLSFIDDGFSTLHFQGIQGVVGGHFWSEASEPARVDNQHAKVTPRKKRPRRSKSKMDEIGTQAWSCSLNSVCGEVTVSASGRLVIEVRHSSIVQALHEAEAASMRLGTPQTARLDNDDVPQTTSYSCVKAGDVIHVEVGSNAKGTALFQLRTGRAGSSLELDDIDDGTAVDRVRPNVLLASFGGSIAHLEVCDFRAHVGDLALSLPPRVKLSLDVREAEINAEGIGKMHMHASWEGLGQPVAQHTSRQISVALPRLPSSGGAAVRVGDMGQMSLSYDAEVDVIDIANRLLDEETMHGPLAELASMFNLKTLLQKILNFARVVRNVLRSEGMVEPKDVIPAERLARLLARVVLEVGTDGKHITDSAMSPLEKELLILVKETVDGKGLDTGKVTRLLWDFLPADAVAYVQEYSAEVDFVIRWLDSILRPTEVATGADPSLAHEPPPCHKYRRDLQEVAPSATRLYEAIDRPGKPSHELEGSLFKVAPYLTTKQVEYVLRCKDASANLRQRLKFLLGLKRRVEKVSQGYGGLAFMPQGMAVGLFLATAIRGSFQGDHEPVGHNSGFSSHELPSPAGQANAATGRLAAVLREQRFVAAELARLQEYQQQLVEEAVQLVGLDGSQGKLPQMPMELVNFTGSRPSTHHDGQAPSAGAENQAVCMLDLLAPDNPACVSARASVRANAALAAQEQAADVRRYSSSGSGLVQGALPAPTTFELGQSLLGPAEVAVLLQSGLAAFPQGRQVQQNQRMLLEILVSQPPLFIKGVLYELSNNGSSRVLSNHLLALLDLNQDTVRPHARLDVADLLTTALGVQMPRRADFMAGGSQASNSYILFVMRAAKQVLEECEPYVALKQWLQRAEIPMSLTHKEPVPAARRAIEGAIRAVEAADSAGAVWLQQRGPVWHNNAMHGSYEVPGSKARTKAVQLYKAAFAECSAAFKAQPEVLQAQWFKDFWARNYDALTVVSVLRNLQNDTDSTRHWMSAQLKYAEKSESYTGVQEASDALWLPSLPSEMCLVDCLIEVLFYYPNDRERLRNDCLVQLVIDEPPGHYDFIVVSAMGVITEGAAGTEMAATYARLEELRGVKVVRADTATLHSVDYNATCIERAVRDHVRRPWGWVGYSQGCANAFRAEAMMLEGTPQQQQMMNDFRCRQLLFSAANGSAHATCSDLKLARALIDGERFVKRFQASMSAATQQLLLDLLSGLLTSHVVFAVLGSMQSLTHEGARRMWRDGQHCHRAPTTSMRGIIETHSLPECLQMLANALVQQMDYSQHHDTQVAVEEAVAHPISVQNANAELLARVDMRSAVQRTHHWSPLSEEVSFVATARDEPRGMFDMPKDRHIFPWLDVNVRFGVIDRVPSSAA